VDPGKQKTPEQTAKQEPEVIDVVFADKGDPDYRAMLAAVRVAGAELARRSSFELAGFRLNPNYVREMKRYGILPADYEAVSAGKHVDPYAIDRAYWRSFWWPPPEARALRPEEFLAGAGGRCREPRVVGEWSTPQPQSGFTR
jgi:hypothetical protein